jgi:hypothetical protein
MEGRIDEREIKTSVQRFFSCVPPGDLAAFVEAESLDIRSSTFDRSCVCVHEQYASLRPERRGSDAKNPRAATEIDDPFRRLVAHEARECVEQELATRIELLRTEDARAGCELELEALATNGLDRGEKCRGVFGLGSLAGIFLETRDAGAGSIGDDDGRLIELLR